MNTLNEVLKSVKAGQYYKSLHNELMVKASADSERADFDGEVVVPSTIYKLGMHVDNWARNSFREATPKEIAAVTRPAATPSLIPFDLEKALNGAKVVTEDRTEITDLHEYNGRIYGLRRLTALSWDKQGNYLNGETDHPLDLFLLPEEKVAYRNLYNNNVVGNCHGTLEDCKIGYSHSDALCVLAFTTIGDRTTVRVAHTY